MSFRPRPIDDWRTAHRKWSVKLALFWGAATGAVLGLAAFVNVINPWLFLGLNVFGYGTIAVARYIKQPGTE